MTRLNFHFELHGEGPLSPWSICVPKIEEVRPGKHPALFSLTDMSALHKTAQAFDPPPQPSRHFVCVLSFSLAPDFTGHEPMFALVERLGLPSEDLIAVCRSGVAQWLARRAKRDSRRSAKENGVGGVH